MTSSEVQSRSRARRVEPPPSAMFAAAAPDGAPKAITRSQTRGRKDTMFRSGRTTLLGLVLAGPVLVAMPHAMAAQSHLDASSDTGAIADETSETGNVSYLGSGIDAWASASSLALRSSCSADSDDGHHDFCDVVTTFSNVARIDPGSSGRSNGDAVTLALTVNLEGALLATYTGPPEPEDQPPSFIASALLNAQVRVTAPDRLVCQEDDGVVVCRPAEIASF